MSIAMGPGNCFQAGNANEKKGCPREIEDLNLLAETVSRRSEFDMRISSQYKRKKTIAAIDLFCGAGGLTRGLLDAGVEVRLGIDLDDACRYPYEANDVGVKFLLEDVTKLKPAYLSRAWADADVSVLAGCAPCQPFSNYTQGKKWDRRDRWSLIRAFGRLVEKCSPDIVTMENVASLIRHDVFNKFCNMLRRNDYHIVWDILDCRLFGLPQSRKRLVLIASRLGNPDLPVPSHPNRRNWKTVRKAIGRLPVIRAGQAHPNDRLHVASGMTPLNLKRIRASKPGGTWRDWPGKLVAPCHRRRKGCKYSGVYGRMEWDAPSPTITGQCYGFGNGRFGHPRQSRAISLREAALLQSFSARYSFVHPDAQVKIEPIGQLIGNAVPPLLGKAIGIAIRKHVRVVAPG